MLSREYTDWHLTPRGWESGTEKRDHGTRQKRPPKDRVLTARWLEEQSSVYSKFHRASGAIWKSKDTEIVNALLAKFGPPPERL